MVAQDERGPVLTAALSGRRRRLTDGALARAFLSIPLLTLKVVLAIHWQALLIWLKGVPIHSRPGARSSKRFPSWFGRKDKKCQGRVNLADDPAAARRPVRGVSMSLVRAILSCIERGRITVVTPGGHIVERRGRGSGPEAVIMLHNWRALRRLLLGGAVGFAQAFIDEKIGRARILDRNIGDGCPQL